MSDKETCTSCFIYDIYNINLCYSSCGICTTYVLLRINNIHQQSHYLSLILIYQMYCIMQCNILIATPSFITSKLVLAIYGVQYLQAMSFLRNKIPYHLLKPYQNHMPEGEAQLSMPQIWKKQSSKFIILLFHWTYFHFFIYYANALIFIYSKCVRLEFKSVSLVFFFTD